MVDGGCGGNSGFVGTSMKYGMHLIASMLDGVKTGVSPKSFRPVEQSVPLYRKKYPRNEILHNNKTQRQQQHHELRYTS